MIPKIAHITTIDMSLRYLLLNQLRSIRQAGYEVVAISSPGPNVPVIESAGIRHIPVPMTRNVTPLADLISLWRLYWMMRREQFTIVHAHTPKAELLGQMAARLAGVPIIVDTFRGIYFRDDMHPLWRRLFMGLAKVAAFCADTVLSQSNEAMLVATQAGMCPPKKIKFLGNGIDVQRFDPDNLNQTTLSRMRINLALTANMPVIGFVGRLVQEKGLLTLLKAVQIVRQQLPTIRLLIIGPIDKEKPDALTPEIAQKYGLGECCIFTGLRDDMPEVYALMDVFVLPSQRESFPRSPMEASAMGVPCVVTDIPGCREAVEHNRNGLLVPLGNVSALAKSIIDLLTHPEKTKQMGATGRRMALARFDERLVFKKVKTEYRRLLLAKGLSVPDLQVISPETLPCK